MEEEGKLISILRAVLAAFSCGQQRSQSSLTTNNQAANFEAGASITTYDDDDDDGAAAAAAAAVPTTNVDSHKASCSLPSLAEASPHVLDRIFVTDLLGLPKRFSYNELLEATKGFEANVGEGTFGTVFKGEFGNRKLIAVKRIEAGSSSRGKIGEAQFLTEIAIIASIQHFNLARLLGYYYIPNHHRYLVYEFIDRGSLETWIFRHRARGCLSWAQRYQVALDVAKAIRYLHHECREKVLHQDIKPENILLSQDFRAKLGDFGLSRLIAKDERWLKTKAGGTFPYMSPDFLTLDGLISEKSDVYSYGMVLFELVHGERNVSRLWNSATGNRPEMATYWHYPEIVEKRLRRGGSVTALVDPRLLHDDDQQLAAGVVEQLEKETKALLCLALLCTQEDHQLRPDMAEVVDILELRLEREAPPPPPGKTKTQFIMLDISVFGTESYVKYGEKTASLLLTSPPPEGNPKSRQPSIISAVHAEISRQMIKSMA